MSQVDERFTPVSEIGEFGLIDRIKVLLGPSAENTRLGIGDDAAVIRIDESQVQLVTTDALIEGVHFDRTFTPMGYLGFKSIAVNVSDIVAMNGFPSQAVVALGLPNNMSVEMVENLYGGMNRACAAYDLEIVGGDTTASHALVLAVTVLGTAVESDVCYRSGANVGDLICVSGDLGSAYAGLKALLSQKDRFEQEGADYRPDLDPYRYVVQRLLVPQARTDIIREWRQRGIKPSSLIDISDGLASEIHHICAASSCGAVLEKENIPIHDETRRVAEAGGDLPLRYALYGGEDYELLFTLSHEDFERCDGLPMMAIGEITPVDEGVRLLATGGDSESLERSGFRHF